jgi:hypothetical protein
MENIKCETDIRKIINQIAFKNLSEGITETFEKNNWSDEDFFEIVEKYRNEKRSKNSNRKKN